MSCYLYDIDEIYIHTYINSCSAIGYGNDDICACLCPDINYHITDIYIY